MKSLSKRFSLLALSLLALPLHAAGIHQVGFGVSVADDEYNELRQSVALLADGSFATVWNTGGDARLQILRPDGSKVFPDDGRSVLDPPLPYSNIVVAANPAGGAFVAASGGAGAPGGTQVLVQSFDADGNPRWATGGVFAAAPGFGDDQVQTQLVAAPRGGVYVCFRSFHKVGGRGAEIVCQRLSAGGQRLWTDQGVSCSGGANGDFLETPKIVRDDRNGLLVFWRNNHVGLLTPNEHVEVKGQHLAPDGTRSWGAKGLTVRTTRLTGGAGGGYASLAAASDGQGGAVLSFNDGTSVNDLDVFTQRIAGDGRLLWRNGVALATGSPYQANDSLTATADGGAFVTVWLPLIGQGDQLWLYRLAAKGKVLWKQRITSGDPLASASDFGAYASFDGGRLRLAWEHYRSIGNAFDVYLAVYDLAGHRLNGADGTPLTSTPNSQFLRGFAFDPVRKQGLAVWDDQRKPNAIDFDTLGALYQE
ncbi:MAG TPA: hypothetical protein VLR69_01045 [Thermoanaerobaculia bacterium]|nr:hypothetical protein [Thermoanaerobaculia bacterium]